MTHNKALSILLMLTFFGLPTEAQQIIRLYAGKAPGSEDWTWVEKENTQNLFNTRVVYNVTEPTLTAYLPAADKATGTAVIIAPGGGFHTLSIDSEGNEVAQWLQAKGVAAFVLKYRLVRSLTDDPVQELMQLMGKPIEMDQNNNSVVPLAIADAKKAVEYVRSRAKELDIVPNQIGFMGFSAGGTVTMGLGYSYAPENRPDFLVPIYPYMGALKDQTVPKDAPPIWICTASDDQLGLAPQSTQLYNDWIGAKKPAELLMYARGGHGFGMRKNNAPSDHWIERFGDWMKDQGYLKKLHPTDWERNHTEAEMMAYEKLRQSDYGNLARYQAENMQVAPPKPGENRVVFMGNSITEFWVNFDPEYFTKNHYIGRGISGQTTPQMLLRFRQDVLDLKPKVLVISAGINDIAENTGPYNPDFTFGNIANMAEIAKANNIKVVIASIHPAFEFPWRKTVADVPNKVIQMNARLKAYCQQNKLVYLDYHSAMKDDRNGMGTALAEDGIHPTLAGYKIMEGLADRAIKEALK